MISFPIDKIKDEIQESIIKHDFIILKSTPGSGKTTKVPLFLHEIFPKKIYVLEPRRLAAKLASIYVAKGLKETPGKTVGHIFKYENETSQNTKIIFLTEGTFVRILKDNPNLDDTDVVILDEFHERHYHTDIALSFLLEIKKRNSKLKIVIMSATIDTNHIENFLANNVKVIELNDHKFPLEISYLPNDTLILKESIEKKVINAIDKVIKIEGHILIFLPGMYEINLCHQLISQKYFDEIIILHGDLGTVEITDDFYDLKNKKIILSTNIAESSVTIPGVRIVIDSGLHRTANLNRLTGLQSIELKKISQSSAIQRANRASREAKGYALRLYSELDYLQRPEFDQPEILRMEISDLIIKSLDFFNLPLTQLKFLNELNPKDIEFSQNFLEKIGFIKNDQLTINGNKLKSYPFHPRVSRMLYEASQCNEMTFHHFIKDLANLIEPKRPSHFIHLVKKHFKSNANGKDKDIEFIYLVGFIDQIAKLRSNKNVELIHNNGEIYKVSNTITNQIDPNHELWVIQSLDNKNEVIKMSPVLEEWLYELDYFPITEEEKRDFDLNKKALIKENITKMGAITLSKQSNKCETYHENDLKYISQKIRPLLEKEFTCSLFQRLYFLEKFTLKKVQDFKLDDWLLENIVSWLFNDKMEIIDLVEMLSQSIFSFLTNDDYKKIDDELPLLLSLTDKRKVPIEYDKNNGIFVESYIQDFYGLKHVPRILDGKEKITVKLLGPHKRAIQVTKHLASFWSNAYQAMKSELKRDYPKHYWPDDPQNAKPILLQKNVPS